MAPKKKPAAKKKKTTAKQRKANPTNISVGQDTIRDYRQNQKKQIEDMFR